MDDKSKKVKRSAVVIITVIMLLIISICICVILYSNKLLPEGLHEYLTSVIEKENNNESKTETAEIPFYEIKYELDLPQYNEIEIMDLANINTMKYGSFSPSTVDKISIIKADGKYGLISNQTGKILVEPIYDNFLKNSVAEEKFESSLESIYGLKDGKYDIISLLTYKTKKDVIPIEHEEVSNVMYDETKGTLWIRENETFKEYSNPTEETIEKYDRLNIGYGICILKEINSDSKNFYGYYDIKTNKILIKPEFEKVTFFQDGVAGVIKNGKAYFISEKNVRISDEYFEDVSGMHKFKSWIKQDGKWKLAYFPKIEERAKIYNQGKDKEQNNTTKTNTTNEIKNTNN